MSRISRTPQIGDLIVRKYEIVDRESSTGIVIEIKRDRYAHGDVFIHWFDDGPSDYQERHGYSETNLHNLRSTFDIYRDGKFLK